MFKTNTKVIKILVIFIILLMFSNCKTLDPVSETYYSQTCRYYKENIYVNIISNITWSDDDSKVYFIHTNASENNHIDENLYFIDLKDNSLNKNFKLSSKKILNNQIGTLDKNEIDTELISKTNEDKTIKDIIKAKFLIEEETKIQFNPSISSDLNYEILEPTEGEFVLKNLETKKEIPIEKPDLSNLNLKLHKYYQIKFFPYSENLVYLQQPSQELDGNNNFLYTHIDLQSGKLSDFKYFGRSQFKNSTVYEILGIVDNFVYYGNLYKYDLTNDREIDLNVKLNNGQDFILSKSGKYIVYQRFVYHNNDFKNGIPNIILLNLETKQEKQILDGNSLDKGEKIINTRSVC